MVLLLFYDGTMAQIPACEDVIHKPGSLVCIDFLGAPIASFLDNDILGYTLTSQIINEYRQRTVTPRSDPLAM